MDMYAGRGHRSDMLLVDMSASTARRPPPASQSLLKVENSSSADGLDYCDLDVPFFFCEEEGDEPGDGLLWKRCAHRCAESTTSDEAVSPCSPTRIPHDHAAVGCRPAKTSYEVAIVEAKSSCDLSTTSATAATFTELARTAGMPPKASPTRSVSSKSKQISTVSAEVSMIPSTAANMYPESSSRPQIANLGDSVAVPRQQTFQAKLGMASCLGLFATDVSVAPGQGFSTSYHSHPDALQAGYLVTAVQPCKPDVMSVGASASVVARVAARSTVDFMPNKEQVDFDSLFSSVKSVPKSAASVVTEANSSTSALSSPSVLSVQPGIDVDADLGRDESALVDSRRGTRRDSARRPPAAGDGRRALSSAQDKGSGHGRRPWGSRWPLTHTKQAPKMAPGDWLCPSCSDHQFARNPRCRCCGEANPLKPTKRLLAKRST